MPDPEAVIRALPAPALRRHAAALRHRHGADDRPLAAHHGRAHHRPRRDHPGRRPRPRRRPQAGVRVGDPLHHPRPRRDRQICDRVGVMYAGEFVEQARLRELFARPLHPYTLDLLGCVPHFDPTPEKRSLVTIPGAIPRVDELPPGCIFAPRCEFVEEACTHRPPTARGSSGPAPLGLPPLERRAAAGRVPARGHRGSAHGRSGRGRGRSAGRGQGHRGALQGAQGRHPRRGRRGPRGACGRDARRGRRERQRQDHRRPGHHRAHAGDGRRHHACEASPCRGPRANGLAPPCARSRWCSRTRTRRSTRRVPWAMRSCARSPSSAA